MQTISLLIKPVDYWFDKTLKSYVVDGRQRVEINSKIIESSTTQYVFYAKMTVLFYSPSNHDKIFCSITSELEFSFETNNITGNSPMVSESIFLLLKHQYQLVINIFRQHHYATLILPTPITLNKINEEVFIQLGKEYKQLGLFQGNMPISERFNPYY